MNFDYVYKFHKVTDNSKNALLNRKIWLSTQESLNDPFEGITKTIYPSDREAFIIKCVNYMTEMLCDEESLEKSHAKNIVLQRYIENPEAFLEIVLEQAHKEHRSAIEHTRNLGIYSTSADIPNDERSHVANMIMWSLYADGFKGFCIKYNAKELYRSLRELNSEDKFSYAKVNYVTKPHEVDLFSLVHKGNIEHLKALQCKHEQWGHECECRILCTSTGLKEISQNSIEAIYFGDKISSQNEIDLIEIMQQSFPNTPVFRVKLDDQSYGIKVGKKM